MIDWTAGYVADVGYTYGYYKELNPLRMQLAFANAGLVAPKVGTACELGFGQGLSTNIHAATTDVQWFGTDFNPAQAAFAQELAEVSRNNARLFDESFSEFANRQDLPDFDFIGMHGIWSWVSDANRQVIVDFIRRKLKVGGVLYVSYNTQPGWASFAPIRHLMTEHAEIIGSEGKGLLNRISEAIDFADKLLALNTNFSKVNPYVSERLKGLKAQNPHYLAHEYFNKDWHPMHFGIMGEWLESAKMQYACSANYMDHVDILNFSPEQSAFLNEISDPGFRQSVRDFMVNEQFRKDYWVKGARKMTNLEKQERLSGLRVMLVKPRKDVSLDSTSSLGEFTMTGTIYNPILDVLADNAGKSLGEIAASVAVHKISWGQVVEAVIVLIASGDVTPVNDNAITGIQSGKASALNHYLMDKARSHGDIAYLASPVTAGGIQISRFEQLFLQSIAQGKTKQEELVAHVWGIISLFGQKLIKDGKVLNDEAENIAELNEKAAEFISKWLPIIKNLKIV